MMAHGIHGTPGRTGLRTWAVRFFRVLRGQLSLVLLAALVSPLAASAQPIPHKVEKAPAEATLIPLSDNWRMDGDVPVHALLISLQGLANRDYPRVYLEYPKDWQWEIVRPLEGFLERRHGIKFNRLNQDDADAALGLFSKYAKGYVVWDKAVRTSLIVAFTIGGVEDAIVVSEDLVPVAEKHGLKQVADLRGQFKGMTDAAIYQWAFDHYWTKCSRDFYVLLGGHAGIEMQPGIADFGVKERAFFSDLSANPKHPEELALEKKILSHQNPTSVVIGWHSYGKDTEGQHTTLVGNHGLKM